MENPQSPLKPSEHQDISAALPTKRPGSVTILILGVLIITVINLARFILSIMNWDFLSSLPVISPWYFALTGLVWTVAGSILLWGLWSAKTWSPTLLRALVLTYALYYWLDHLFLMDHSMRLTRGSISGLLPGNWQFAVGVTIVCLAFTAWVLGRQNVKIYFRISEPNQEPGQAKIDE